MGTPRSGRAGVVFGQSCIRAQKTAPDIPQRNVRRRRFLGLVALDGVLDVFADLLRVGDDLVLLAFGLQAVVVRGVSGSFLGLAAEVLRLVLNLVSDTHGVLHLSFPVEIQRSFTITRSMLTNSSPFARSFDPVRAQGFRSARLGSKPWS